LALAHLALRRFASQQTIHSHRHIHVDTNKVTFLLFDEDVEGGGSLALEDGLLGAAPARLLIA
jgi:hypothetical protein